MTTDNLKLIEQVSNTWERLKALDVKLERQEQHDWNYGDLLDYVSYFEEYQSSKEAVLKAVASLLWEFTYGEESMSYMYEDAIYTLLHEHGVILESVLKPSQKITDALEIVTKHYDNL